MKKVLFSLFFFSLMIAGASAQKADCSKTCGSKATTSSCQAKASSTAAVNTDEAAAKLASMDKTIESRTCPVSGTVSYFRKEKLADGTVKQVDLTYDASVNAFVNVSPTQVAGHNGCSAEKGKAAATNGKSCCASGTAKAASGKAGSCCTGGKAQKSAAKSN